MSMLLYVLAAVVVTPFILACWAAMLRWDQIRPPAPAVLAPGTGPRATRLEAKALDLPLVMREVADAVEPLAKARATRIRLAVSPGRTVWADRDYLSRALRELVETAVHASPGGQVLISAMPLGTELNIAVTDDARNVDLATRESMARDAGDLIAMQGGRMAIEARAGFGTTVTVRLPLPAEARVEPDQARVLTEAAV